MLSVLMIKTIFFRNVLTIKIFSLIQFRYEVKLLR